MKAIETLYQGCRFRSRLEARWAVFFDTLGIRWEYEKEGYDLDGTRYLPDFWLPEHKSFIEIKGQEPTEDEKEKADRLAYATGQDVHIRYGDVWVAPGSGSIYYPGAQVLVRDTFYKKDFAPVRASYQLYKNLQAIQNFHIITLFSKGDEFTFKVYNDVLAGDSAESFLKNMIRRYEGTVHIMVYMDSFKDEIKSIVDMSKSTGFVEFRVKSNNQHQYLYSNRCYGNSAGDWWCCRYCKALGLTYDLYRHEEDCTNRSRTVNDWLDMERIMSAYGAARGARFEYGEQG